jgi:hypothetical protein
MAPFGNSVRGVYRAVRQGAGVGLGFWPGATGVLRPQRANAGDRPALPEMGSAAERQVPFFPCVGEKNGFVRYFWLRGDVELFGTAVSLQFEV